MFLQDGYVVLKNLVDRRELQTLREIFSESKNCGTRNYPYDPLVFEIGNQILAHMKEDLNFQPDLQLAWINYFDKSKERNWKVPMHIDEMVPVLDKEIAVKNGISEFRDKEGQRYGKATEAQLRMIVAARLSLDDTNEENGPLIVWPSSHRGDKTRAKVKVLTEIGDVVIMSPLLYHSSDKTQNASRRRVLHYNFVSKNIANFIGNNWIASYAIARQTEIQHH